LEFLRWTFLGLLFAAAGAVHAGAEPQAVLQANVARAIAVLDDARYADDPDGQQQALCSIALDLFDAELFSKLALAEAWKRFDTAERQAFVQTFGAYLCRYYLSRLQRYYAGETVEFTGQTYKSDNLATVTADVLWQGQRIPVIVRMARRAGRWRAYDMALLGVSAVLVYRSQFADALRERTPAELIDDLRTRSGEDSVSARPDAQTGQPEEVAPP